jgi:uncharacterized membrane protein (Fun14 family)
VKRKYTDRLSLTTLGLAGGGVVLVMTNWRLVLTLSIGIFAMILFYQNYRSVSPNQRLLWAVLGSSFSMFVFYLFIVLIQSSSNFLVGFSEGIEFLAILSTLGLVLYQNIINKRPDKTTNQLILYLASEDDLTRLIALRQLHQRVINCGLSFQQEEQLKEYCQIILEQEDSNRLRNAALETIETLQFRSVKPKLKRDQTYNDLSLISPKEVA